MPAPACRWPAVWFNAWGGCEPAHCLRQVTIDYWCKTCSEDFMPETRHGPPGNFIAAGFDAGASCKSLRYLNSCNTSNFIVETASL
jgi:hypothetical protein